MARFTAANVERRRARSSPATRGRSRRSIPLLPPRPGAGRLRHRRRDGAHRRAGRRHAGRGARHVLASTRCSSASRSAVPRQRLHEHLLPADRRRGAARTTPRSTLGIKAGGTTADGTVHARGRRVHRGLHRGAVPAGELPLLPQGHARRRSTRSIDDLRAGRRAARGPDARHARPGPPADPRRPRAPATPCPATAERAGVARTGPRRRRRTPWRSPTPRRSSPPASASTTATPSTATSPPAATRACAPRCAKPPAEVGDEVKAASLLGRGGAGFPAGIKWGFCPPGVWPRYLVVNGDESEPGTYKDRLLMERDPHQLIEGVLIACYAVGAAQAFLYVRGEMALAQERIAAGPQRGLRRRLRRQEHPRHRLLRRHRPALGRRRLHRRRGDRAHRVASRATGACRASSRRSSRRPRASTCSRRSSTTSRRWPTCRGSCINGGAAFAALGAETQPGHAPVRGVGPREASPGVYEVEFGVTTFRDLIYAPVYGGGIRDGNDAQGVHPRRRVGAVVLRGAPRPAARGRRGRHGRLDARLGRDRRHGRRPPTR